MQLWKSDRLFQFMCLCALLLAAPFTGLGEDSVADLRNLFEGHLATIESERTKELDAQRDGYSREMEQLQATFQRAGDLENWQAATAESERFARERVLPEATPEGTPERIRSLQKRYDGLSEKTRSASAAKAKDLTSKYLARLSSLQVEATRRGNLEKAIAYREETQRVQALNVAANPATASPTTSEDAATEPPGSGEPATSPLTVPPAAVNPNPLQFTQSLSAPATPGMTFKTLVLSATDRMRTARRVNAQMDIEKALTPRVGMRSSNTETHVNAKLLVQTYARGYGSHIVPVLMSTWLVDVPKIEATLWTFVQLPNGSTYSSSPACQYYYCQVSLSGGEFYGAVVSIYDAKCELISQSASAPGLASLAPAQFPADIANRRALNDALRRRSLASTVSETRVLPNGQIDRIPSEYMRIQEEVDRLRSLVNGH